MNYNIPKNYIKSEFWLTCDQDGSIKEHVRKPIALLKKYISQRALSRNILNIEMVPMSCVMVVVTKDNKITVLPSQDAVMAKGWYLVQLCSGEIMALYFDGEHGFYKNNYADFVLVDFDSINLDFERTPLSSSLLPATIPFTLHR